MNVQVLIDQIVRQTMVLIAQLATSGGSRAPLAHIADRVFIELARELQAQGLSRQVSADMFGVALRTYRRRIQRLGESATDQGRSLWSAVLEFVPTDRLVTRTEIFRRFKLDDEAQVASILSDLCDSGFLLRLGRGVSTAYRATTADELSKLEASTDGLTQFLWLLVYREGPLSRDQLLDRTRVDGDRLDVALDDLCAAGRVSSSDGKYRTAELVVPADAPSGWEAAMLDHFQAVVNTLCSRLRGSSDPATSGGSTYTFVVSPTHPLAQDVYGHLKRSREELSALRNRVDGYNAEHPVEDSERVVVYLGQNVQKDSNEDDDE